MRFSSIGLVRRGHSLACLFTAVASAKPQPKTAAAVIAADNGWEKAEESGDVAYVDNLLLPDYRSVNADGSVHDKAAILANTKQEYWLACATPRRWRSGWRRIRWGPAAVMQGDTAIVTFHLKPLGPEKGIMSSDIFVYRDGQWHAIYSQHTNAGK